MLRHLILRENEPPLPFDLSDDEAYALSGAELAAVSRTPGGRGWHVAAGTKVGVVRVGDLQVSVRPKIPVARLLFMVGYARHRSLWREMPVELKHNSNLPDALAHAFAYWARHAVEHGLLQGYLVVEESLPVVRGRIRVSDQLARRPGRNLPLEVTYDDFTVDVVENRLLLAATLRLLAMPQVAALHRRSLQRIRVLLSDITPLNRGSKVPRWTRSRLNARYQPALQLVDLILAGDSFEQRVGDLRVSGFVFDMWRIYEDFVTVALKEAMSPYGGHSSLQHRMHLDVAGDVPMRPDFLWTGRDGHRIVVDAKYKAEKPEGFPNGDLYQLLAYCAVLGIPSGHLVYAAGNEKPRVHKVTGSGVNIYCHTLNLAAPPGDLLTQVDHLAESLAHVPRLGVAPSGLA